MRAARVADGPSGSRRRGWLARDSHDSAVSSQNPMAPCSWWVMRNTTSAASTAASRRARASATASGRPVATLHSAYLASSSTPTRSTSASVSWNCTPWNDDSGWPNWWRSRT